MAKKESYFWTYLRGVMAPHWEVDRIESGSTTHGFPDVVFATPNVPTGYIELKAISEVRKRDTSKLGIQLSQMQVAWLIRRRKLNPWTYVFVKIVPTREYFLWDAQYSHRLNDATRDSMPPPSATWKNKIDPIELLNILEGK